MSESGDEILLAVCTGNVCRSPYVALSLGARLRRDGIPVQVDSAGTHALVGSGVAEEVVVALSREGVDASLRRARQLTIDDIDRAAFIVALSREHRSVVSRALPTGLGQGVHPAPARAPDRSGVTAPGSRRTLRWPRSPATVQRAAVSPRPRPRRMTTWSIRGAVGNSVFTRSFEQMRPGVTKLHRALEILVAGPHATAAPTAG